MVPHKRRLAIGALSALVLGATGCGSGASGTRPAPPTQVPSINAQDLLRRMATHALAKQTPQASLSTGLHFRALQYSGAFINAGSPQAFTLFETSERVVTVGPRSSAHFVSSVTSPPRFASAHDRRQWRAAGSPKLPFGPSTAQTANLAAGTFGFLPVGVPLTYYDARHLPASSAQVRQAVETHLRVAGHHPPPSLMLRAYGFLLAIAPLRARTRAAIFSAIQALPVHATGTSRDLIGRAGELVSADDPYDRVELLLDPRSDAVLAVQLRVLKPQPAYPGISAGTLIESDTFIRGA